MGTAFIVYGGNKVARFNTLSKLINVKYGFARGLESDVKIPDLFSITVPDDKKSIGIAQIKNGITFLQEKPFFNKYKVLIVYSADKMTTEAQNALLKTLEEPPSYGIVFLETAILNSLLETVQSRCRKINVKDSIDTAGEKSETSGISILSLIEMDLGNRLATVEDIHKKEKDDIIQILESWITQERDELLAKPTINKAQNLKKIIQYKRDLQNTNVNTRLALETLVLNLE